MKRLALFSILFLGIISFTVQLANSAISPSKKKPRILVTGDLDKGVMHGHFDISVFAEGKWQKAGRLMFGKDIIERKIEYFGLNKIKGTPRLRITQVGGITAHLDSVLMDGKLPVKINGKRLDSRLIAKIGKMDNDVIVASEKTFELEFAKSSVGKFSLSARVKPHVNDHFPFQYPRANEYSEVDSDAAFYIYKIGSKRGKLSLKGDLKEVSEKERLFKEYAIPGSGHPRGYTYGYVKNDDEYLYAVLDFTSDNTEDGGMDHGYLHVKTGNGVKEYMISDEEIKYGRGHYLYNDKVSYQHKYYEFKIPLAEIGSPKKNDELLIAFSAFGSGSLIPNFSTFYFPDTMVGASYSITLYIQAVGGGTVLYGNGNNISSGPENFSWKDWNTDCGDHEDAIIFDGEQCDISLIFAPQSTGFKKGSFEYSWPGNVDIVELEGTGVAPGNYTLDVTMAGTGRVTGSPGGIDCPGSCSQAYTQTSPATNVTLTPAINDDAIDEFEGWGGACAGVWRGSPCTVTMNQNRSVEANFKMVGANGDGPDLLEPPDGATFRASLQRSAYRDADVTFKWKKSSDADGDEVSYKLWICDNKEFEGCDSVNINSDGSLASLMGAGAIGVGFILFGFAFRDRRRIGVLLVAGMLMVGGMAACSSSSSDDDATSDTIMTDDPNVISYTATLSSGVYFWKVTAVDANGGTTDSEVRTFTVGQ